MTSNRHPLPTVPLSSAASRALAELGRHAHAQEISELSGHQLLMERAWLTGARFQRGCSAGGSCRFLQCADGVIALTMVRISDWELVPAWLELDGVDVSSPEARGWELLASTVQDRGVDLLVDRARLLGLAIADAGNPAPTPSGYYRQLASGPPPTPGSRPSTGRPRVVDLSALWAGPLCGHLLHLCGAEVIKVESGHRPDGARAGNPAFYGLLNQGKRSVELDLRNAEGCEALRALMLTADIVIESSRPRALEQMGIRAADILRVRPGLTWISITGHGREAPQDNWIAFGDDAGVAAGLSEEMHTAIGSYQFAGDAIADPLTGIHGALAAWDSWQNGGNRLLSLSLTGVAAWCLAQERNRVGAEQVNRAFADWWHHVYNHVSNAGKGDTGVDRQDRPIRDPVATQGEHTGQVMLTVRC